MELLAESVGAVASTPFCSDEGGAGAGLRGMDLGEPVELRGRESVDIIPLLMELVRTGAGGGGFRPPEGEVFGSDDTGGDIG